MYVMTHYKAGLYDSKLTKNMLISCSYEMGLNFLFQNNPKDLDLFYKMDLELPNSPKGLDSSYKMDLDL